MHHIFFVFLSFQVSICLHARPAKGSRLQGMVLLFVFFCSSRFCSLTFFFYLNKIFSFFSCTFMLMFVLRSLSLQLQWLTKCNRWMSRHCAVSLFSFFFSLLLFLYHIQINERRRTNGSFYFLLRQIVSTALQSRTYFYHLICHLICYRIFFRVRFVLMSMKEYLLIIGYTIK